VEIKARSGQGKRRKGSRERNRGFRSLAQAIHRYQDNDLPALPPTAAVLTFKIYLGSFSPVAGQGKKASYDLFPERTETIRPSTRSATRRSVFINSASKPLELEYLRAIEIRGRLSVILATSLGREYSYSQSFCDSRDSERMGFLHAHAPAPRTRVARRDLGSSTSETRRTFDLLHSGPSSARIDPLRCCVPRHHISSDSVPAGGSKQFGFPPFHSYPGHPSDSAASSRIRCGCDLADQPRSTPPKSPV
jgi:hypothetical protein